MVSVEVPSIWDTLSSSSTFNNHIAYSLLARLSEFLFGRHEWVLRLPSLLLGLGALYWIWGFARIRLGPTVAITAALALALSPSHVLYSQMARGYAGMALMTIISSHLYLKIQDQPSLRKGFMFTVASSIGIYFHLYASVVTIVQMMHVIYLAIAQIAGWHSTGHLDRRSFRILWLSFAAIVIISVICYAPLLPLIVYSAIQRGHGGFKPFFPFNVLEFWSGSTWEPLTALLFFVFVVGLASFPHATARDYLALLFVLPLFGAWVANPYDLYERFFVYYLPYYTLFLVFGLFSLWSSTTIAGTYGLHLVRPMCVIVLTGVLYTWATEIWDSQQSINDHFREATYFMIGGLQADTTLCALGGAATKFRYYSTKRVVIPESLEEFERLTYSYSEIRCAYRRTKWDSTFHREIVNLLSGSAKSYSFGKNIVFVHHTKDRSP
jgi:uncharacterized membrane protein